MTRAPRRFQVRLDLTQQRAAKGGRESGKVLGERAAGSRLFWSLSLGGEDSVRLGRRAGLTWGTPDKWSFHCRVQMHLCFDKIKLNSGVGRIQLNSLLWGVNASGTQREKPNTENTTPDTGERRTHARQPSVWHWGKEPFPVSSEKSPLPHGIVLALDHTEHVERLNRDRWLCPAISEANPGSWGLC